MFDSLDRGVRSWIASLTEALTDAIDAVRPPVKIVARRGETGNWTLASADPSSGLTVPIAEISAAAAAAPVMLPEPVRVGLKGADIAIDLPPDWVFRRTLDPVPAKTAAFLDVFVRHHIERVTPWRVADTWYTMVSAPLPTDPAKISVQILVVARSLLATVVPPILAAEPHRLRLKVSRTSDHPPAEIDIPLASGNAARATRLRRIVGATVAAVVIALVVGFGGASWYQSELDSQLDDLDRDIADREAFLASARARLARPAGALSAPERVRAESAPVVDLIETLSAVLPDQVYLSDLSFETGHIRITGIARDIAGLIPLIERSGRFAEVAFFAPTTRLPNQAGDRFFIEMRVRNGSDPDRSTGVPK
jgi:general secretion pathway protein L